ncbi:MAG: LptF/LptG family permease [Phycisphaeraceae bacterium]|nr:LptF/LptG family permease [Phycisphaeraceae bacterium]
MLRLLTRYLAGELLKTILLTTLILVAVIAFGTAIKPLSRNLLGGADILKYVFFAAVPMLEYALPFAAGFGATLVMHRLATDNEILAMGASGLSPSRIFRPIFVLAAVLLLVMLALVEFLIPMFWSRMESLLAHDVTRLLASAVERGEAFSMGDTRIYADDVVVQEAPEGSTADTRLVLVGVAALQLDSSGRPETEFTADYATMDLYRLDGRSVLKLVLGDATLFRAGDSTLVRLPTAEPRAIDLGRGFRLGVKMLTLPEMYRVKSEPTRFPGLADSVGRLEDLLRRDATHRLLADALSAGESIGLRDVTRDATWRIVSQEGVTFEDGIFEIEAPTVELVFPDGRTARARGSGLRLEEAWRDGEVVFDAELLEPVAVEAGSAGGRVVPAKIRNLVVPAGRADFDEEATPAEIVASARGMDVASIASASLGSKFESTLAAHERAVQDLIWDIDGRHQQRLAQACMGPLLLILGSILAVRMRTSPPLTVYVFAFIPAILDIVLISGGEQALRREPDLWGYVLIWSGNLILGGTCLFAWSRLRRN